MRGKAQELGLNATQYGITPAYAGKSVELLKHSVVLKDHPRVCGEKFLRVLRLLLFVGSPPRMRGKEREGKISRTIYGITPAYAGKRGGPRSGQGPPRDHPRVCGEK